MYPLPFQIVPQTILLLTTCVPQTAHCTSGWPVLLPGYDSILPGVRRCGVATFLFPLRSYAHTPHPPPTPRPPTPTLFQALQVCSVGCAAAWAQTLGWAWWMASNPPYHIVPTGVPLIWYGIMTNRHSTAVVTLCTVCSQRLPTAYLQHHPRLPVAHSPAYPTLLLPTAAHFRLDLRASPGAAALYGIRLYPHACLPHPLAPHGRRIWVRALPVPSALRASTRYATVVRHCGGRRTTELPALLGATLAA